MFDCFIICSSHWLQVGVGYLSIRQRPRSLTLPLKLRMQKLSIESFQIHMKQLPPQSIVQPVENIIQIACMYDHY